MSKASEAAFDRLMRESDITTAARLVAEGSGADDFK
jgi:hypothetical protein